MSCRSVIALMLAFLPACDRSVVEPCSGTSTKPIVQIAEARNASTGALLPKILITNPMLDGAPLDPALTFVSNIERAGSGFFCTIPCLFGSKPGTYTFTASAQSFYQAPIQVVASYTNIPAGCPATHGSPARVSLALLEADSARVAFGFATRTGTGLTADIVSITFNDGSGDRTTGLRHAQPPFPTLNSGNLHVRVVLTAPDTLAVGEIDLPLMKDWQYAVMVFVYDRNPQAMCIPNVKSFALRRAVPNADSLYIAWAGTYILNPGIC